MSNEFLLKMRQYIAYEYICPQCNSNQLMVDIPKVKQPMKMYSIDETEEQIKNGVHEEVKFEGYYIQCRKCNYTEEYEKPIKPNTDSGKELPRIVVKVGCKREMTDEEKIKAFDNIIYNVK